MERTGAGARAAGQRRQELGEQSGAGLPRAALDAGGHRVARVPPRRGSRATHGPYRGGCADQADSTWHPDVRGPPAERHAMSNGAYPRALGSLPFVDGVTRAVERQGSAARSRGD